MKIQLLKNILKGILQTCLHSHLNKLLISRPTVSRYRNDNVRPVKSFKPLSLSLSLLSYHERKSRGKTRHNWKEEILEAPRKRERCINQTDRGDLWRGMDKVVVCSRRAR